MSLVCKEGPISKSMFLNGRGRRCTKLFKHPELSQGSTFSPWVLILTVRPASPSAMRCGFRNSQEHTSLSRAESTFRAWAIPHRVLSPTKMVPKNFKNDSSSFQKRRFISSSVDPCYVGKKQTSGLVRRLILAQFRARLCRSNTPLQR